MGMVGTGWLPAGKYQGGLGAELSGRASEPGREPSGLWEGEEVSTGWRVRPGLGGCRPKTEEGGRVVQAERGAYDGPFPQ